MIVKLDKQNDGPTTRYWDEVRLLVGERKIEVLLVGDGEALTGAYFGPARGSVRDDWVHDPAPLADAASQLEAYAAGERTDFDLTVRPAGTPFQEDVWDGLTRIPYGTTTTYGRLAEEVGRPGSGRAVGAAVGRNPIGIIIPCHRVIGADGSLTGFGGGLDNKAALLRLEGISAL